MSADGPGVLENDLALDVHDDFFERYDAGDEPAKFAEQLLAEYEDATDQEIVVAALLHCLWELGAEVTSLRTRLEEILTGGISEAHWGPLRVGRERALRRLLTKTATPKAKPMLRKPGRSPKKVAFQAGDYLIFTKANGRAVPVIVWFVERQTPLRYDFVFPNLGRSGDPALLARLLDTRQPLTDDELALFLSPARRPRVFTLEHQVIKPHLGRFRVFGNRLFAFPTWQCGTSGYGVTFTDFERRADEGGGRALTAEELAIIASPSGGMKP